MVRWWKRLIQSSVAFRENTVRRKQANWHACALCWKPQWHIYYRRSYDRSKRLFKHGESTDSVNSFIHFGKIAISWFLLHPRWIYFMQFPSGVSLINGPSILTGGTLWSCVKAKRKEEFKVVYIRWRIWYVCIVAARQSLMDKETAARYNKHLLFFVPLPICPDGSCTSGQWNSPLTKGVKPSNHPPALLNVLMDDI